MPKTKHELERAIILSRSVIKSRATSITHIGITDKTYINELIAECQSLDNMIDELKQLDNE